MKQIIAILGMCGTGKSTVSNLIKGILSGTIHEIYFGDFVQEELNLRQLEKTAFNVKAVRQVMREQGGEGVLAHLTIQKLKSIRNPDAIILLDGLYSLTEFDILKKEYGNMLLCIAVHADKAIRYKRLRHRPFRSLTASEVDERDRKEIERHDKGGPIALADYHLVNNGSLEELASRIDSILQTIHTPQ